MIDTSVNSFRPIPYSARDTCETQAAVAEHNAVYDTLKTGKPVVYKPPCVMQPKPSVAPSAAHPQPARKPATPTATLPPDVRERIRSETEWHRPNVPEIDAAKAKRTAGL